MSPRDLAYVGCRLLAVYVFLQVVQAQITNAFFYLQALAASEDTGFVQNGDFDIYFGAALTNLFVAVALWFAAGWLSGKVAKAPAEPHGKGVETWSPQNAVAVIVIAVGILGLIMLAPNLAYIVDQLFHHGNVQTVSVVYLVLAVAIALVFVLSPRGVADFIARYRRW